MSHYAQRQCARHFVGTLAALNSDCAAMRPLRFCSSSFAGNLCNLARVVRIFITAGPLCVNLHVSTRSCAEEKPRISSTFGLALRLRSQISDSIRHTDIVWKTLTIKSWNYLLKTICEISKIYVKSQLFFFFRKSVLFFFNQHIFPRFLFSI